MNVVLLYGRCVLANRFTLIGYSIVITCGVLLATPRHFLMSLLLQAMIWLDATFLVITRFGFETFQAYRRVVASADRHGRADARVAASYRLYCGKTGALLAERDLVRAQHKARTE